VCVGEYRVTIRGELLYYSALLVSIEKKDIQFEIERESMQCYADHRIQSVEKKIHKDYIIM
jgi:hypothetical protein